MVRDNAWGCRTRSNQDLFLISFFTGLIDYRT